MAGWVWVVMGLGFLGFGWVVLGCVALLGWDLVFGCLGFWCFGFGVGWGYLGFWVYLGFWCSIWGWYNMVCGFGFLGLVMDLMGFAWDLCGGFGVVLLVVWVFVWIVGWFFEVCCFGGCFLWDWCCGWICFLVGV